MESIKKKSKEIFKKVEKQTTIYQKLLFLSDSLKRWIENDNLESTSETFIYGVRAFLKRLRKFYFIQPFTFEAKLMDKLLGVTEQKELDYKFLVEACSEFCTIDDEILFLLFFLLYKYFSGFIIFNDDENANPSSILVDYQIGDIAYEMIKRCSNSYKMSFINIIDIMKSKHMKICGNFKTVAKVYFLYKLLSFFLTKNTLYLNDRSLYYFIKFDLLFDHSMHKHKYKHSSTFAQSQLVNFNKHGLDILSHFHSEPRNEESYVTKSGTTSINYKQLFEFISVKMWNYNDNYLEAYLQSLINNYGKDSSPLLIAINAELNKKTGDLTALMKLFTSIWPPADPFLFCLFHFIHNWHFKRTATLYISRHYITSFYITRTVLILKSFTEKTADELLLKTFDEIVMRYIHQIGPEWSFIMFKKMIECIDENLSPSEPAETHKEFVHFIELIKPNIYCYQVNKPTGRYGYILFLLVDTLNAIQKAIKRLDVWEFLIPWIKYYWIKRQHSYYCTRIEEINDFDTNTEFLKHIFYIANRGVYHMSNATELRDTLCKIWNEAKKRFPNIPNHEINNINDIKNHIISLKEIPGHYNEFEKKFMVQFYRVSQYGLHFFSMFNSKETSRTYCRLILLKNSNKSYTGSVGERVGRLITEFCSNYALKTFDEGFIEGFGELISLIRASNDELKDIITKIVNLCQNPDDINEKVLHDIFNIKAEYANSDNKIVHNLIVQVFLLLGRQYLIKEFFVPNFNLIWLATYFDDYKVKFPFAQKDEQEKRVIFNKLHMNMMRFRQKNKVKFFSEFQKHEIPDLQVLSYVENLCCQLGTSLNSVIGQYFFWESLYLLKTRDVSDYLKAIKIYIEHHRSKFQIVSEADNAVLDKIVSEADRKLAQPDKHIFFIEIDDLILDPENFFLVYFYLLKVKDKFNYEEDFSVDFLYWILGTATRCCYLVNISTNIEPFYGGMKNSLKYLKENLDLILHMQLTQKRICYIFYIVSYILGEFYEKNEFRVLAMQMYRYYINNIQADFTSVIKTIKENKDPHFAPVYAILEKLLNIMK